MDYSLSVHLLKTYSLAPYCLKFDKIVLNLEYLSAVALESDSHHTIITFFASNRLAQLVHKLEFDKCYW